MPRDLEETIGKEVYYPDEIPELGTVELVSRAVYEPDEVEHDDAQYGLWMKVENGDGEKWISAPSALREAIAEKDSDVFNVRSVEKGPADHDPYQIDVDFDPQHH